jgi:hypothetical protein
MGLVYAAIPLFAALSVVYTVVNLLIDVSAFSQGRDALGRPSTMAE